ncbi:MAG: sensor domain-containing diguanylate cyclase, partial [Wenzhouxiangellaceae bacterium]
MNSFVARVLVGVVLLAIALPLAWAEPGTLRLPAAGEVEQVKAHMLVREDADGALDPTELLTSDAGFVPFTPALDAESGPVWLKLRLQTENSAPDEYALRVARRFFQRFELIVQTSDGSAYTSTASFNRATDAEYLGRQLIFPIRVPPGGETTLLLFIETVQGSLQPLELWVQDRRGIDQARAESQLLYGLVFGVMLALVFHNLVLYFSLRHPGHLYYVLAMTSLILLLAADSGILQTYLLPDALQRHAIKINTLLAVLTMLTITAFFRAFVVAGHGMPRLSGWTRILVIGLGLAVLLIALIPDAFFLTVTVVVQFLLVASLLTLLIGGYRAGRNGIPEGYIFLLAWSAFVISGFSRTLMTLDLIARHPVLERMIYFGAMAEAVILALGLAWRVRQLYDRHARALEEQHKVARLANVDPLTNAYNRRFLKNYLESVLDPAGEADGGRALLMLDLDHFKEANDRHGHAAGDAILVELVERCRKILRQRDIICRMGGD